MARLPLLVAWLLFVACKRDYQPLPPPPVSPVEPLASAPAAAPVQAAAPAPAAAPVQSVRPPCQLFGVGEHRPQAGEAQASGAIERRITRQMSALAGLVESDDAAIVFKDEEGTGADRLMAPALHDRLHVLGQLVAAQWPGLKLRVTEAWDENGEHGGQSLHYEGRAADLTTSDRDAAKLGCLAGLAVQAGFDWVYYERTTHVHASVKR